MVDRIAEHAAAIVALPPGERLECLRTIFRAIPEDDIALLASETLERRVAVGLTLRTERGARWTLGDAARALGVKPSTLSDAERGRNGEGRRLLAALRELPHE